MKAIYANLYKIELSSRNLVSVVAETFEEALKKFSMLKNIGNPVHLRSEIVNISVKDKILIDVADIKKSDGGLCDECGEGNGDACELREVLLPKYVWSDYKSKDSYICKDCWNRIYNYLNLSI